MALQFSNKMYTKSLSRINYALINAILELSFYPVTLEKSKGLIKF